MSVVFKKHGLTDVESCLVFETFGVLLYFMLATVMHEKFFLIYF